MSMRTWLTALSFSALSMGAPKANAAPVQDGDADTLKVETVSDVSQSQATQDTKFVTKEGFTYSLPEKGVVKLSTRSPGRVDYRLMPKLYSVKGETGYFCGSQKISERPNIAERKRDLDVGRIIIEESVIQDMMAQGVNMDDYQAFINNHQKMMSSYGFRVVNGELTQQDPSDRAGNIIETRKKVNEPVKQQTYKQSSYSKSAYSAYTH